VFWVLPTRRNSRSATSVTDKRIVIFEGYFFSAHLNTRSTSFLNIYSSVKEILGYIKIRILLTYIQTPTTDTSTLIPHSY